MFTENNDWEGETWNFFVPLSPEQHEKIKNLIESVEDFDSPYEIGDEAYTESYVDKLISSRNNTRTGYMKLYNKCKPLSGVFLDRLMEGNINLLEDDPFYKGQCWDLASD